MNRLYLISKTRRSVAGFSIAMVLIYMSIASGIGYALSVYMGNVSKTYKASEVEQVISLYTMNLQRMLTHAEACTRTFNPGGTHTPGTYNGTTYTLNATVPADRLVLAPGERQLRYILNTTVPGVCGALPCEIRSEALNVGSGTIDQSKQVRVKEIRIRDLQTPRPAGCDPSRGGDLCSEVKVHIYFEKLNALSLTKVIKRSFQLQVRVNANLNTQYCYSTIDRDYADQDLFVNKAGDTMTGELQIKLDPVPATPTRALYVKDGYIQTNLFYIDSDRRLKKNIHAISEPFKILDGIQGREFNWRDYGDKDYGFIAQEVEKNEPQLVITDPKTNFKAMRYASLIPVTTEAIKLLRAENEVLRSELKKANELLGELEKTAAKMQKGNK